MKGEAFLLQYLCYTNSSDSQLFGDVSFGKHSRTIEIQRELHQSRRCIKKTLMFISNFVTSICNVKYLNSYKYLVRNADKAWILCRLTILNFRSWVLARWIFDFQDRLATARPSYRLLVVFGEILWQTDIHLSNYITRKLIGKQMWMF